MTVWWWLFISLCCFFAASFMQRRSCGFSAIVAQNEILATAAAVRKHILLPQKKAPVCSNQQTLKKKLQTLLSASSKPADAVGPRCARPLLSESCSPRAAAAYLSACKRHLQARMWLLGLASSQGALPGFNPWIQLEREEGGKSAESLTSR